MKKLQSALLKGGSPRLPIPQPSAQALALRMQQLEDPSGCSRSLVALRCREEEFRKEISDRI